jgi:hypothetical protein
MPFLHELCPEYHYEGAGSGQKSRGTPWASDGEQRRNRENQRRCEKNGDKSGESGKKDG